MSETTSNAGATLRDLGLSVCTTCGALVGDEETHEKFHAGGSTDGQSIPLLDVITWVEELVEDEIESGLADQLGSLSGGPTTTGGAVKAWLLQQVRSW